MAKSEKTTVNHAERAHALLSASGASRWINCTPSPRLEESFPQSSSFFAEEGTLAHEFAEINLKHQLALLTDKQYEVLAGPFRSSPHYSEDMEEEVQKHIDYVIQQYTEAKRLTPDAVLLIEDKIDLTAFIEDGFGTSDDTIIADGTLEVIDLKYGKGLRVSAEDNSQLKLYGLGALYANELAYDIHTVRLTIVQPRLDAISSWEVSAEDLKKWGEEVVRPKALEAYAGEGKQAPGEWCQFCKAKPKCRALSEYSLEVAKKEFRDPQLLSDKEVLEAFEKSGLITNWLASVGSYIFDEALAGKKWEGYKLVEGRSNRVISNPDLAEQALIDAGFEKDQFTNTKLKGLGDLEKLLKKDGFNTLIGAYVTKPEGKPTLAPESDKRDEYGIAQAVRDFED